MTKPANSPLPDSGGPGRKAPATLDCDLLVVGGGVNGVGIARDAVGRGLRVVLCEQDDLAAHTSSSSTKLIHGGLRYLEHYEFGLVRKALIEREVLLRNAPHIMWPLRFVMPHDPSMRPAWMIRLGIFLYDHLARREILPGSETIALAGHAAGAPLQPGFRKGFVYSDGWVDDARLVVLNARDAADRGATILPRTRCEDALRDATGWSARLQASNQDVGDADAIEVRARALVNAAGPWAESFLRHRAHHTLNKSLRLIKGSHIVVPRMFDHDLAYIFQSPDKRIVFAIPYERDFTLVGTTDVEFNGEAGEAHIGQDETRYLCALINRYFKRAIAPSDVVWSYSGVRPLLDDDSGDASAVTRDYALDLDQAAAPLLSVWGGKITTYRKLAEEAVDLLAPLLQVRQPAWTHDAPLPGGDLSSIAQGNPATRIAGSSPASSTAATHPTRAFQHFVEALQQRLPWADRHLVHRWARAYGTRVDLVVGDARCLADLGAAIAPGLFEAELRYLCEQEWASEAEDVLWRRSKLGLHYTPEQRAAVARWLGR